MKKKALLLIITFVFVFTVCGVVTAANGTIERVSISSTGEEGDSGSGGPSISADGRYVAFISDATNLVNGDKNGFTDVFVYDRVLNVTERVSVSSTWEEANSNSFEPSISGDGCYVVFASDATNLVADDNNGFRDIFLRDRLLKTTKRISISSSGEEGNSASTAPSISANGRFIAFSSHSCNLVPGDTNSMEDIFVYDQNSGIIQRVGVSSTGQEAELGCWGPSISADGRFIAFHSYASNLVPFDTNGYLDIFIHDRISGITERASISSTGVEGNSNSCWSSISGDGRLVAFSSQASNLVSGDTNGREDIFVHDRLTRITERVSISSTGEENIYDSFEPSMSVDGRYVAFTSGNRLQQLALRIGQSANPLTLNGASIAGYSSQGNLHSYASKLVGDDNNNFFDVFVRDLRSGITKRVSISSTGEEANSDSGRPAINADGTCVAFQSRASNLVVNDTNGDLDVFVYSEKDLPPIVTATINPAITKSGNTVTIRAYSDPDTATITAEILGETHNLVKQTNGTWTLNYTIPNISNGSYPVTLTAKDFGGNLGTNSLSFTVDNTPPSVSGTLTPTLTKTGNTIKISASSDPDTANITATALGTVYNLTRQINGSWSLNYVVPVAADGVHPVILIATDIAGNQGTASLSFTIDNTPPTISAILTPESVKVGEQIKITVQASPDTKSVTAIFINQRVSLSYSDGFWRCVYIVPVGTSPSIKSVDFEAIDNVGNLGKVTVFYTIIGSSGVLPGAGGSGGNVNSGQGGTSGHYRSNDASKDSSENVGFGNLGTNGLLTPTTSQQGDVSRTLLTQEYANYLKNLIDNKRYGDYFNEIFWNFNIFNYVSSKSQEAAQKAWVTGNIWDYFNYPMFHIYGYSNLDETWGGQNIKFLLDCLAGIDENGNMSILQFLLNLAAIIPIGRLASIAGKALSGILERAGIKIGLNLADNVLARRLGKYLDILTQRLKLGNFETWKNAISWIGNVLLPNPVGWFADIFKGLAKLTGNEKLIAAATAFSSFEFKRGLGELGNLLVSPDPIRKIWNIYDEVGGFLNRNLNYIADISKNFVKGTVNAVKASVSNVVNKITTTVKQIVPKAVTTVKKVVNKVANYVKTTVEKVVTKTKTVVKKVATTVKKTVKKVVITVKKVVIKAVSTVKKAVNTVKKAVSSTVNWVKSKIRWPW